MIFLFDVFLVAAYINKGNEIILFLRQFFLFLYVRTVGFYVFRILIEYSETLQILSTQFVFEVVQHCWCTVSVA